MPGTIWFTFLFLAGMFAAAMVGWCTGRVQGLNHVIRIQTAVLEVLERNNDPTGKTWREERISGLKNRSFNLTSEDRSDLLKIVEHGVLPSEDKTLITDNSWHMETEAHKRSLSYRYMVGPNIRHTDTGTYDGDGNRFPYDHELTAQNIVGKELSAKELSAKNVNQYVVRFGGDEAVMIYFHNPTKPFIKGCRYYRYLGFMPVDPNPTNYVYKDGKWKEATAEELTE